MDEIHIWRLQDAKLIEHWACRDERAALRHIGGELDWPDGADDSRPKVYDGLKAVQQGEGGLKDGLTDADPRIDHG
jgi:hypothetical protein